MSLRCAVLRSTDTLQGREGLQLPHTAWEPREKPHAAKLGEQRISQSIVLAVNPLRTHYFQLLCTCRIVLVMIPSPAPHLKQALTVFCFAVAVSYALIQKMLYILDHSRQCIAPITTTMTITLALSPMFLSGFVIYILDWKKPLSYYSSILFIIELLQNVIVIGVEVLCGLVGQYSFCHRQFINLLTKN